MLNFVWNATLNRLGAGALAFYIGTQLPGGIDYLSSMGIQSGITKSSDLLEGLFFLISSYFLGSILVGLGRGHFLNLRTVSWVEELAKASTSQSSFLQASLMSHIDRSDAYAGLGAALACFSPMSVVYLYAGEYKVGIFLTLAALISILLLKWARDEHDDAAKLIARHFALSEPTK